MQFVHKACKQSSRKSKEERKKIGEMVNFPRNVSSSVTFAFTHLHFDLALEYSQVREDLFELDYL